MRRRNFIVAAACGLSAAAHALGADAAWFIVPDGRAHLLQRFTPAAGPLQRHTSRPGAWYALLYVPMAPAWPMRLLLWPGQRSHEIRLFALDAAPDEAPTVVHPMAVNLDNGRDGRAHRRISQFMLPASSTAPAIFVLIEQWRIAGDAPQPLWVQLQTQVAPQHPNLPWWATRPGGLAGAASAAEAPPSPLTQQLRSAGVQQIPIFNLPAAPDSGVWR